MQSGLATKGSSIAVQIKKQFETRVQELRSASDLYQEELADKAGVHKPYLDGIERGERNASSENVAATGEALGVALLELVSVWDKDQRGSVIVENAVGSRRSVTFCKNVVPTAPSGQKCNSRLLHPKVA